MFTAALACIACAGCSSDKAPATAKNGGANSSTTTSENGSAVKVKPDQEDNQPGNSPNKPAVDPEVQKKMAIESVIEALKPLGVELSVYGWPSNGGTLELGAGVVDEKGLIKPEVLEQIKRLNGLDLALSVKPKDPWFDATLEQIASCKCIGTFYFDNLEHITDAGIESLLKMPQIETLHVNSFPKSAITDSGLAKLAKLPKLGRLSVDCDDFNSNGSFLAAFNNHPKLKELLLSGDTLSDAGLAGATTLPGLNMFEVDFSPITGEGLAFLKSAKDLERVRLSGDQLTDAAVAHLESLPKLDNVLISAGDQSKITDRSLQSLATLPALKELWLAKCNQITDEGWAKLAPLQNLKQLQVDRCQNVTDKSLPHLAKIASLEVLLLSKATITEEGLDALIPLKKLTGLGVHESGVTDAEAAKLKEKMPNLKYVNGK